MNQIKIGNYIQLKRKEINITQDQLADKLGVSNKTISKWECGKAIPDYSVVENLCEVLNISLTELFSGEDSDSSEDVQMIEMLERIQELEKQKRTIYGVLLIILGIACFCMSELVGGSNFKDFISGLVLGLSICEMLAGIFVVVRSMSK